MCFYGAVDTGTDQDSKHKRWYPLSSHSGVTRHNAAPARFIRCGLLIPELLLVSFVLAWTGAAPTTCTSDPSVPSHRLVSPSPTRLVTLLSLPTPHLAPQSPVLTGRQVLYRTIHASLPADIRKWSRHAPRLPSGL